MLSEEGGDDPARLGAERVWIVDPLDGTREFGEPPRTDWAVHVALVIAGVPVAGAVALPALGLTLATEPPPPAPPPRARPAAGHRQPHPAAGRRHLARRARWTASWSRWARPAPRPWPSCAARPTSTPTRGASTSGTRARRWPWPRPPACTRSRLDGSPLVYNNADPYLPDLLICRPELAAPALEALRHFEG